MVAHCLDMEMLDHRRVLDDCIDGLAIAHQPQGDIVEDREADAGLAADDLDPVLALGGAEIPSPIPSHHSDAPSSRSRHRRRCSGPAG